MTPDSDSWSAIKLFNKIFAQNEDSDFFSPSILHCKHMRSGSNQYDQEEWDKPVTILIWAHDCCCRTSLKICVRILSPHRPSPASTVRCCVTPGPLYVNWAWTHPCSSKGLHFPQGLCPSAASIPCMLSFLVPMYGVLHHWHRHPPFWVMTQPGESVWGGGQRGEGVPSARNIDRQQRTAAAFGSRRISLHCDLKYHFIPKTPSRAARLKQPNI